MWIMQYLQSHFTQQNLRNQNQDQNWELLNEQRDVDKSDEFKVDEDDD